MSAVLTDSHQLILDPSLNGVSMTPEEFENAEGVEGWRYQLLHGVLLVTPAPLINERDPNGELGYLLRRYDESNPQSTLDVSVSEHDVITSAGIRRVDRAIWAGLGRLPDVKETPTIAVEFVSAGRRSYLRDYEIKRDEFIEAGVLEYWVFNRFESTLTVFSKDDAGKTSSRVFTSGQDYLTPILPGFKLPLARIFELANRWPEAN